MDVRRAEGAREGRGERDPDPRRVLRRAAAREHRRRDGPAGGSVLGALGPRPAVFQYHYDTFGEPENGTILGRTGALNQALRIGDRAWGVQFHIEVSPGAIYSWLGTYGEEMRSHGVDLDALVAETAERWRGYRKIARRLAEAFAREVRAFAERRSGTD